MGCYQLSWKNEKNNNVKQSSKLMQFSSNTSSLVLHFRNEENLVALLVHSSFRQVATSVFLNNSVATSESS